MTTLNRQRKDGVCQPKTSVKQKQKCVFVCVCVFPEADSRKHGFKVYLDGQHKTQKNFLFFGPVEF